MENRKDNIYFKILVNFILYIAVILIFIYVAPVLLYLFAPFIIGWFIAGIANPLVGFLEKRVRILRKYSSALIIILIISLILFLLYAIIRFIILQSVMLIYELPTIIDLISDTLMQVSEALTQTVGVLPDGIQNSINQLGSNIENNIIQFISDLQLSEATLNITSNIGSFLFFMITLFISTYFFIKDREKIISKVRSITPASILEKYDLIKYHFKYAVGGYIKAQFKIMLVVIAILYVGFKIIDTPYAFLIAVLTGVIDLLPIFGTGFVLWPWALIELILGNYIDALTLIGLYLGTQLIKNVIQPKMVADSVGLDPLITLVFMYIGFQIAGLLGLIISIPLGLILENLYEIGMFDNLISGFKILIKDINDYRKF